MKVLYAAVALASVPCLLSANEAPYPTEKVAAFVVERLDAMTLPQFIRPKHAKGKKTLADYGFTPRAVEEKEARLSGTQDNREISIRILEQNASGIFACVESRGPGNNDAFQRVLFIKYENKGSFLKSRESFREFAECPEIGNPDSGSNSYGG